MNKKKHESSAPPIWDIRNWPAVVYLWGFVMALVGYVIIESVFHPKSHAIHWLSAIAGGLLGFGIGWLWFRLRGDVP